MNQNHIVLTILLLAGMVFISGCVQQQSPAKTTTATPTKTTTQPANNFLTYDSSDYGIRMQYPSDWSKNDQATVVVGMIVAFSSPKQGGSDAFQENVNVLVQDLSAQPMTLDQYTELNINQLKQLVTDVDIIESSATTLGGNPAHKVVYTGRMGKYNLKVMQLWAIKDNDAFVITYTAEVDEYSTFLGNVQQMIDSFEFI